MFLVGENINIVSKKIGLAIKNKETKPIQEMAVQEKESGMDYLDINLGPARKQGPELMEWLVKTVQEVVDLPLFLDTSNIEALEAGLRVHKGKAVINSISCRPERMEALFPLAKKYNAGFVGLLVGIEGIPRDAGERGVLAAELLAKASDYGIPNKDIFIDPIILPVSSQQNQGKSCLEFMQMFQELAPGCGFTCGLSNISNGSPEELRPLLNRTCLIILQKYGMTSAIVDAFDTELVRTARGERGNLQKIVWNTMEGNEPPVHGLNPEEVDYLKTTKVLLGHFLYSHSWLKI